LNGRLFYVYKPCLWDPSTPWAGEIVNALTAEDLNKLICMSLGSDLSLSQIAELARQYRAGSILEID
jgi:O-succinylbenzoate synthase